MSLYRRILAVLVEQMTNIGGCASLIQHAKTVMIASSVTEIPEYVVTTYRYVYGAEHEGVSYTVYSQIPCAEEHEHIFKDEWRGEANGHGHPCVSCDTLDEIVPHEYEDACDPTCQICGSIREPRHSYYYPCDALCSICGTTRETTHTYDHACDPDCNFCKKVRAVTHTYGDEWSADEGSHWKVCTVCGKRVERASHSWDDGKVAKESTESAEGERIHTCLCGETYTEAIPKVTAPDEGDEDRDLRSAILITVVAALIAVAVSTVVVLLKKKKSDRSLILCLNNKKPVKRRDFCYSESISWTRSRKFSCKVNKTR